mgnify:CR=1 FL=1
MNQNVGFDAVRLKEGFNNFHAVRQPHDVDLVSMVRDALFHAGLGDRIETGYNQNPLILEAGDKRPSIQRWMLNRYWVTQFVSLRNVNTMEVRLYLVPGGTEEDWLRMFIQHVLPFVIQHGLPTPF